MQEIHGVREFYLNGSKIEEKQVKLEDDKTINEIEIIL